MELTFEEAWKEFKKHVEGININYCQDLEIYRNGSLRSSIPTLGFDGMVTCSGLIAVISGIL